MPPPKGPSMPSDKRVVRTLADGTTKTYTYPSRPGPAAWTLGRLIEAYRRSLHFQRLADETRRSYLRHLEYLRALADVPVAEIRRRHIRAIRDELGRDRPATANAVAKLARTILEFAIEDDIIPANPLIGMRHLPGGEHAPWTEAQLALLPALHEPLRRAAVLALYTGQRASDVVRMTWSDYDGAGIALVQQKTGTRLWVPAHRELRAELDRWEKVAVTMLVTLRGTPWASARALSTMFCTYTGRVPELEGATFHGLRKTAATRLAEAGCSIHEIAATTGHQRRRWVKQNTGGADQMRRAAAAIFRLENARKDGAK